MARAVLERRLVDVEDQVRRRRSHRRRHRRDRQRGNLLRRYRRGLGHHSTRRRATRTGKVLDRHRAAVDEELEVVLSEVQHPSLFASGDDDVDAHHLDLDPLAERFRGIRRRLRPGRRTRAGDQQAQTEQQQAGKQSIQQRWHGQHLGFVAFFELFRLSRLQSKGRADDPARTRLGCHATGTSAGRAGTGCGTRARAGRARTRRSAATSGDAARSR